MTGVDYHIHTHYVGCADETMTLPVIIEQSRARGRTSIAITDHCDKDWQLEKNRLIRQELERTDPGDLEIFFGCELNVQTLDGDLVFDESQVRHERFELVIAGVHSIWYEPGEVPLEQVFERQTDLMCKVAAHPIVDVLVHPWWIPAREFRGWLAERFTSLEQVPDELTVRMVETCIEHGTAIEFNAAAVYAHPVTLDEFKESYGAYVARWVELGAQVVLSSDAHCLKHFDMLLQAEKVLEEIGVSESQVWRPAGPPRVTGSRLDAVEEKTE